jgi:hypothetical protein
VDLRDQVFMIFLLWVSVAFWTFLSKCPSTNGPFFSDLGKSYPPFLQVTRYAPHASTRLINNRNFRCMKFRTYNYFLALFTISLSLFFLVLVL